MMNKKPQRTEVGVKRIGMVIKLRPECVAEYRALHADSRQVYYNRGAAPL